jgi:NAD(P)-dependent dehydrogenase (short-subunit alcohol dehydrogenase family)
LEVFVVNDGPNSFDGKLALVTGGTSGIGLGIAEAMLRRGFRVVVTGRDRQRGDAAVEKLRTLGEAWFVSADAESDEEIVSSVTEAVELLGGLDALVNNAGVALNASLLATPADEFDRLIRVNLHAPFVYVLAAQPHLAKRKGGVVNIASDAGLRGEQPIGAYSVSKAGLVMMSRMLALDLAPDGIRCNCVCPGATPPGMRHTGPVGDSDAGEDTTQWQAPPLGRFGRPEDIGAAVLFFLSEESSFCSGTELLVDGALQAGVSF